MLDPGKGAVIITGALRVKSSRLDWVKSWKSVTVLLACVLYLQYSMKRRKLAIWKLGTGSDLPPFLNFRLSRTSSVI